MFVYRTEDEVLHAKKWWRRVAFVVAAVIAVALLVTVAWHFMPRTDGAKAEQPIVQQEETKASSPKKEPAVISKELKELLDVASKPLDKVSCVNIVKETKGTVTDGTYALLLESLKGVGTTKSVSTWSTSLSTPLKGKSAKEKAQYIKRAICEEPMVGVSLAHLFANLKVEGVKVIDLQSTDWLDPYVGSTSQLNDRVADFMPVTDYQIKHLGADVPDDVYQDGLNANHEYSEFASRLNLLLSRYQLGEVLSIDAIQHYRLKGGGLTGDGVPEIELTKEADTKPSLVFYLTKKTDDCKPISVLAFNVGDKRPMLGKTNSTCKELSTPAPVEAPRSGSVTPVVPFAQNGGQVCVVNCGGYTPQVPNIPQTPYLAPKDPSQDPYVQGNAPIGGGQNANSGPGTYTQTPTKPSSEPRVNPDTPVSQPNGSTPDPTPESPAEPQAPTPDTTETGCTPIPGVVDC